VRFSGTPSNPTDQNIEIKETPKKQGLKSRLGTVMGRRKNAAPPALGSAEKPKKDRNRSSLMPFRRGDSSRSQQGTESTPVSGRDLTTSMSREPTQSSMQRLEADRPSTGIANTEGQQHTPRGSAVMNGTTSRENHDDVNRPGAPFNQTPPSNNVLTPSAQVKSSSEIDYKIAHSHFLATARTQCHPTISCLALGCHISCSTRGRSN
jgi:hypothetical protein